ncbi:hypothetical protein [Streptomyces sp. CA-111067]|jgi:hypothetical protein|uniref:hypothetical protein n=1 Tax=Streptomyces sp. CA-111067 TaxID=3240046 RepID=UPI003D98D968
MLTVAPVLLLALGVVLIIRKSGVKAWHALICALFGFYMASTSMGPGITSSLAKVTGAISGIHI